MSRRIPVLLLSAVLVLFALPADATPGGSRFAQALGAAGTQITVPPEWDGVWSYEDSTYSCAGDVLGVETGLDTLCAGQTFTEDPGGSPVVITCTGTATPTIVDVTCSGSSEVVPDCTVSMVIEIDATLTGDSYLATTVSSMTYSGTAEGCDLIPGQCTRTVSRATRLGPAPADYCITPARPSTWGRLKLRYR